MNDRSATPGYKLTSFLRKVLLYISVVTCLFTAWLIFDQFVGMPFTTVPTRENMPTIIAHRGAASLAPENTIAAVRHGLASGAAYIEIDIHRSRDGELIVMHDNRVNRTTDGSGKLSDLTIDEIRGLRILRTGDNPLPDDPIRRREQQTIPTLDEVLAVVKGQPAQLAIEMKNPADYPGIGGDLVSALDRTEMRKQVCIISFDTTWIDSLSQAEPDLSTGHLYLYPPSAVPTTNLISVHYLSVTLFSRRIRSLQEHGKTVWVWTVNTRSQAKSLLKKGIDGIVTDNPGLLD